MISCIMWCINQIFYTSEKVKASYELTKWRRAKIAFEKRQIEEGKAWFVRGAYAQCKDRKSFHADINKEYHTYTE